MAKRQLFTINGEEFSTKSKLTERIQEILYSYRDGQSLNMFDFPFMLAVLELHPDSVQKIGCGVSRIEVRENPVYRKNFGFWAIRTDGTETDFSFIECLSPSSHGKKVFSAFRVAVEDQTIAFKRGVFRVFNTLTCELTGEEITFLTSHVDHKPPHTFDKLVEKFLATNYLNVSEINIVGSGVDGCVQNTIDDHVIRKLWRVFHKNNCVLRVVSRTGNLSVSKVESMEF